MARARRKAARRIRFSSEAYYPIAGLPSDGEHGRLHTIAIEDDEPERSTISDVIPCGGYQDPRAHAGMHMTQSINREPVRCMYPDEFLATLRKFRHPRWFSIGVACSTVTNNERQRDTIFDSSGTIYVANAYESRDLFVIPCNCIPYTSIATAVWNEERSRWEDGDIVRGWRTALKSLLSSTYLKPDPELSYLIGEDSFKIFPVEARP